MAVRATLALLSGGAGLLMMLLLTARTPAPSLRSVNNLRPLASLMADRMALGGDRRAGWRRDYPECVFPRERLTEAQVGVFFPSLTETVDVYDPDALFIHPPDFFAGIVFKELPRGRYALYTDDLGLRTSGPRLAAPERRIIVCGDSHIDGVCDARDAAPKRLEARLRRRFGDRTLEVLNAGKGAYGFHNYLGTFERLAHLEPDVFVVVAYGGNDFLAGATLRAYYEFETLAPIPRAVRDVIIELADASPCYPQGFNQELVFQLVPARLEAGLEAAEDVCLELGRQARERGVELLFVYLPSALEAQPERYRADLEVGFERANQRVDDFSATRAGADRWLAFLAREGLRSIDLRPVFAEVEDELYWHADHHINLLAQQVIAKVLEDALGPSLFD